MTAIIPDIEETGALICSESKQAFPIMLKLSSVCSEIHSGWRRQTEEQCTVKFVHEELPGEAVRELTERQLLASNKPSEMVTGTDFPQTVHVMD